MVWHFAVWVAFILRSLSLSLSLLPSLPFPFCFCSPSTPSEQESPNQWSTPELEEKRWSYLLLLSAEGVDICLIFRIPCGSHHNLFLRPVGNKTKKNSSGCPLSLEQQVAEVKRTGKEFIQNRTLSIIILLKYHQRIWGHPRNPGQSWLE